MAFLLKIADGKYRVITEDGEAILEDPSRETLDELYHLGFRFVKADPDSNRYDILRRFNAAQNEPVRGLLARQFA